MIANFYEHREEFEQIVKWFHDENLPITDNDSRMPDRISTGSALPTAKLILEKITVNYIDSDWELWIPPDPYSREAIRLRKEQKINHNTPGTLKYQSLKLDYEFTPLFSLKYMTDAIYKGYYYIPVIPKKLLTPSNYESYRMFYNLDTIPEMENFECVCRRIEPQWYILLCIGKQTV